MEVPTFKANILDYISIKNGPLNTSWRNWLSSNQGIIDSHDQRTDWCSHSPAVQKLGSSPPLTELHTQTWIHCHEAGIAIPAKCMCICKWHPLSFTALRKHQVSLQFSAWPWNLSHWSEQDSKAWNITVGSLSRVSPPQFLSSSTSPPTAHLPYSDGDRNPCCPR